MIPVISESEELCTQLGDILVVKTKNQGPIMADMSKTKVHFFESALQPIVFDMPSIDPGQTLTSSAPFSFELPGGTNRFRVTVDSEGSIVEENEDNNEAVGECNIFVVE